jgi:hypothetical protein
VPKNIAGEASVLPGAFPLGPFLVEESGKLTFRSPHQEAALSFVWHGRRFSARIVPGRIKLSSVIGHIPSSASGAHRRKPALMCLRELPPLLPAGWALRLSADHRVHVDVMEPMGWPAHATDLMLPLLRFLLQLGPYLDLLDESELGLQH